MSAEHKRFSRDSVVPRKYYLSQAAVDKLEAESQNQSYSMSVVLDLLIKKYLPPTPRKPRDPAIEAARKERFDL